MMKSTRQLLLHATSCIIIVLGLCLTQLLPVCAYTLPTPSDAFYVTDTAGLLSQEANEYIVSASEDLYEKTGVQIVVVTVDSLEGASLEEYATDLFRTYGIGSKDENNGVLFLLSVGDREVRIEVGYGLEGAINDGKAGRILDDYVIPYFVEDQWEEGIKNGYDAILDEVCKEYDVEVEHTAPIVKSGDEEKDDEEEGLFLFLLISGTVIGLIVGLSCGKSGESMSYIFFVVFAIIDIILCFALLHFMNAFCSALFNLIGWGAGYVITAPDDGSYYSSSYDDTPKSKSSSSSGGGSRSHNSGGGGRSGGGGASRKF